MPSTRVSFEAPDAWLAADQHYLLAVQLAALVENAAARAASDHAAAAKARSYAAEAEAELHRVFEHADALAASERRRDELEATMRAAAELPVAAGRAA